MTSFNSITKQMYINKLKLSYDLLNEIKSYCFYDRKTWELMNFIKYKKTRFVIYSKPRPFLGQIHMIYILTMKILTNNGYFGRLMKKMAIITNFNLITVNVVVIIK